MIMIPGGPGNDLSAYNTRENSITKTLLPFVNIILFDPRGVGKSAPSNPVYCDLNKYTEDVEAIRQHFKLDANKLVIFGQSYGAIAATAYAIKYDKYIKKLFLICGVVDGSFLKSALDVIEQTGTLQQKAFIDILWNGKFTNTIEQNEKYIREFMPLWSERYDPTIELPPLNYNDDLFNYGFSNFLKKSRF